MSKLIKQAEELEKQARALRQRVRWGDANLAAGIAADALIEKWCIDPDMWATHGLPPDHKLERMARDIAETLRDCANLNRA